MSGIKSSLLLAVIFAAVAAVVVSVQMLLAPLFAGFDPDERLGFLGSLKAIAILVGFSFVIALYGFGHYRRDP